MDHIFSRCKESCWLKVNIFIWIIKNKIMKKKKIPAKIASGKAFFSPLVKAKNQHQNFEKHLKQKRCAIRVLLFFKKIQVNMVKNVENCSKSLII